MDLLQNLIQKSSGKLIKNFQKPKYDEKKAFESWKKRKNLKKLEKQKK